MKNRIRVPLRGALTTFIVFPCSIERNVTPYPVPFTLRLLSFFDIGFFLFLFFSLSLSLWLFLCASLRDIKKERERESGVEL